MSNGTLRNQIIEHARLGPTRKLSNIRKRRAKIENPQLTAHRNLVSFKRTRFKDKFAARDVVADEKKATLPVESRARVVMDRRMFSTEACRKTTDRSSQT
jgi:hypothetical protein